MGSIPVRLVRLCICVCLVALALLSGARAAYAQQRPTPAANAGSGSLAVSVAGPTGSPVIGARVVILADGQPRAESTTDAKGLAVFERLASGRYETLVTAERFEPHTQPPFFLAPGARETLAVALQIGIREHVIVTASAIEVPASQAAASVTVIDRDDLDRLRNPDVLNALRAAPGVQVVQTGARGGPTSLFVRGGNSNFNKILIDGVSANDIGGAVDLSHLDTTGVDRIEILRAANSVLYGSDAMTGVVSVTTRRGTTRVPEAAYTVEGGNLGTVRNDLSFGGAIRRFDYFSEVSHFDTDNRGPNNSFANTTYAGRVGAAIGARTSISATLRASRSRYGSPNAYDSFGAADDSFESDRSTFANITMKTTLSDRWQASAHVGLMSRRQHFLNPTPTGEAFDPFGSGFPNFLGDAVTLHGAGGATVTGRAILDFGGDYPQPFTTTAGRQSVDGQTSYRMSDALDISGGLRVDHESGASGVEDAPAKVTRTAVGGFVEARGRLRRVVLTAGIGLDHNPSFGFAATPRAAAVVYLREPRAGEAFGGTRLLFNAGTGIKAPTVPQEQSSLYKIAVGAPGLANAGLSPIGPERTRGLDGGVEQAFWGEHARIRLTAFDNRFTDVIEFVNKAVLPQLGVPTSVAAGLSFGAYVNSSSFRARGLEAAFDVQLASAFRLSASYTRLSAVVSKSFTGGALAPATNPAFPGVPIGAFSPLVGAHPFRRPANSGTLTLAYDRGALDVGVAAQFTGKTDDSTFLSDGFFGASMLLPNKDLDPAYARVDLTASYAVHRRLRVYLALENALGARYYAVYGFPALPRTARVGMTVKVGGDSAAGRR